MHCLLTTGVRLLFDAVEEALTTTDLAQYVPLIFPHNLAQSLSRCLDHVVYRFIGCVFFNFYLQNFSNVPTLVAVVVNFILRFTEH